MIVSEICLEFLTFSPSLRHPPGSMQPSSPSGPWGWLPAGLPVSSRAHPLHNYQDDFLKTNLMLFLLKTPQRLLIRIRWSCGSSAWLPGLSRSGFSPPDTASGRCLLLLGGAVVLAFQCLEDLTLFPLRPLVPAVAASWNCLFLLCPADPCLPFRCQLR